MALRGAPQRAPRRLAPAALLLAVLATFAAAPAAANASLLVDHSSTDTSVVGGGLIGPNKTVDLNETINSSEPSLTGVTGLLSSSTSGVTVNQGSSSYPDLTFGQQGANTTPFRAALDSSVACGTTLAFSLHVNASQGQQDVPFNVPTGISGPATSYDAGDVPKPIPDGGASPGTTTSNIPVTGGGLAKGVTVRLGEIDHPYDGDLRIELIAPDGQTVVLVDRRGGSGHNFINTVLSDSAPQSITAASAPFTGSYRPEHPLSAFDGHPVNGTWHLKVSDMAAGDTGAIKAWGADIKPAVCTTEPVANFTASPSPAPPGSSVAFDASASVEPKAGETITKYEWDFDGDGTYDQTTSTPTTSHAYAARGQYNVGLRVTDSALESGTTTVPLIVTQPPTVSLGASPNPVQAGDPVTVTATASDPDTGGSITKYEWDLNGDGSFETDTGAVSATSTTFPAEGTYTVRVRVTDSDGAKAVDTATITVDPPATTNQPPVASITVPGLAVAGTPTTLDATASTDPDGSVTQYEWDFNGDGVYDQTTAQPTVSHTFGAAGQVTVGLRVTDNGGSTDATTAKLDVVLAPSPGTISASLPNSVPLNTPITFTDTGAADPNAGGSITKYEWDLGSGTFTSTGTTPSASHAYASNGVRTIRVRVTSAAGATAIATYTLVALNQPPVIGQLTASPNPAIVGQTVTLTVAASDPEGHGIARYDWDLDGNGGYETPSGTSPTVSYAYPNAGPIPVGVRVTDSDGGQTTAIVALQINEAPGGVGEGAGTGAGSGGTGSGGTGTGAGGAGGGGGSNAQNLRAGLVGLAVQRAATVQKRGLAVACRTNRAASCAVTVEVGARDARRYGLRSRGRSVVLGTASGSASVGRDARLSVRLNAAGRRLVGRARAISLLVRGTVRDRQGGRVPVTRVILVKR
jgi:PKD repeat protein